MKCVVVTQQTNIGSAQKRLKQNAFKLINSPVTHQDIPELYETIIYWHYTYILTLQTLIIYLPHEMIELTMN